MTKKLKPKVIEEPHGAPGPVPEPKIEEPSFAPPQDVLELLNEPGPEQAPEFDDPIDHYASDEDPEHTQQRIPIILGVLPKVCPIAKPIPETDEEYLCSLYGHLVEFIKYLEDGLVPSMDGYWIKDTGGMCGCSRVYWSCPLFRARLESKENSVGWGKNEYKPTG